ncbi:MAG: hypothetical protein LBR23_09465 [Spirochaetaceae bacterium]|jgi:hypothetical protein|nr:hypothetical protein [Spirochaetaceae bacterium]
MEFFVNGDKIDITLEGERTAGDVLMGMERACAAEGAAVTGVHIDGKRISAGELEAEAARPLEGISSIGVTTISAGDIKEAARKLAVDLDDLVRTVPEIPAQLQGGKKREAYKTIESLTAAIDTVCVILPWLPRFPGRFPPFNLGGKTPEEFFNGFTSVLSAMCTALQDNDIVMLGDVAEYEVCPALSTLASAVKELL